MNFFYKYIGVFLGTFICLMAWSCSSKRKETKVNLMKNLTAHYNIYFNAREALQKSELSIQNSLDDDFNQLLAIFPVPNQQSSAGETENLNEVINKANTIALEKYESNWLDDAYLLLARAAYLKGDFYNAVEYYSYVGITFPQEKKNKLEAYLGQVKSDFALGNIIEADSVLHLADDLNYKYDRDELEASKAQLSLSENDTRAAALHLEKAVDYSHDSYKKVRWRYILAQLQEMNDNPEAAYKNYDKIVKSNASFEISFNANLSRIRISERSEGKHFDKIATLQRLLKEDKNREFKEQIYYQIGEAYIEQKNYDKGVAFFKTSVHTLSGSAKQKGLSYLRLAQVSFNELKNYTQAQLYYDSTLQYLPKDYTDYKNIAIKANNLQYLATRLTLIEEQKNLLQLANLNDDELDKKVDDLFKVKQDSVSANQIVPGNGQFVSISDFSASNRSGGSFYFYNPAAVSQGLNEFKRKWGDRKLADNWRESTSGLPIEVAKNVNFNGDISNPLNRDLSTKAENRDSLKAAFLKTVPFSPAAKDTANAKISVALYEIALFYKNVLKDDAEAMEAFEGVLLNYPNDANAANIHYQLYRLTENSNREKSDQYKNQLLTKYPNSVYAKAISDPEFGKEDELLNAKIRENYNELYNLYLQKDYQQVIDRIAALRASLGSFKNLEPQFAYLEALAIGNTNKVPAFLASLNDIVKNYPDDQEITPRVKQQIDYISNNRSVFDQRPTALLSYDANEAVNPAYETMVIPQVEQPKPEETLIAKQPDLKKEAPKNTVDQPGLNKEETPTAKTNNIEFNKNLRQRHLIVIDFTDPKTNIAQPFSRLSQYFYSKFEPSSLKLLIRVVGETDKFVIVSGDFYSKEQTEQVANELKENLPKIMEGQTVKYTEFVVSEDNLNLLTTRGAIEQYLKSISEKK